MTDAGGNNTLDCWEGPRNEPNFGVALTVNVPEIPGRKCATRLKFDMTEFFDFQTFRGALPTSLPTQATNETVTISS